MCGGILNSVPQRLKRTPTRPFADPGARPATGLWVASLVVAMLLVGCVRAKPPRMVTAPPLVVAQAQRSPTVRLAAFTPTLVPTLTPSPTITPTPGGTLVPGTEITITVCPKDTLYSLACQFHTTVAAIQARNGLGTSTDIRIGQTLIIPIGSEPPCPAPRIHIVRRGETIYSIARRYGVSVQALVLLNVLTDPNQIRAGQRLVIPPEMPCPTPCSH